MDRKLSYQQEVQRLIESSDAARLSLGQGASRLRAKLDIPSRLQKSLKSHPAGWLVGSLVSGLGASLLFRRKPVVVTIDKKIIPPPGLVGRAVNTVTPLVKMWLADHAKDYVMKRINQKNQRTDSPTKRPS